MKRINTMRLIPLLAVGAAVLWSCSRTDGNGAQPAASAAAEGTVASALGSVSRQGLEAHLAYLAGDERRGRMTGTKSYIESAAYVARQFEALGLEPAGEDGWHQHVPLISKRLEPDGAAVILHRDQGDASLRWKKDFLMGGDDVRGETTVRAEVVYAGYGIHAPELGYSDYEGIDIDGKIVAVFGGAPASFPHNERAYYSSGRTKAQEMVERGAVGWIGVRSRVDQERVPWERRTQNAGLWPGMSWIDPSGEAQDHHPEIEVRVTLSAAGASDLFAGAPIAFEEALDAADAGLVASTPLGIEVTLTQKTAHENITSPNVVGMLRGGDPTLSGEYVAYSAHLDHLGVGKPVDGDDIYNGYYDNAMGVALMIEAARAFAALPEPPPRSILFIAVTGEERGLLGSDYFAHYPTVPRDSIVANVNLDMPLLLYPLADIIAFGAEHSSLEPLIETAIAAEGFELTPDPMPEEVIFIRSDQFSFVRQGVPSVYLIGGFTSTDPAVDGEAAFRDHLKTHYHQPSDDTSRPVDWESALRFARANVRIGFAIAGDAKRPSWNEGDFFGERFGGDRRQPAP